MKERLTGAVILVALIVLLVPELLTGPVRPSPSVGASSSSEEPPLRSYTISLSDEARSKSQGASSSGPAMPQPGNTEPPGVAQPGESAQPGGSAQAGVSAQPMTSALPSPPVSVNPAPTPPPAQKSSPPHNPKPAHTSAAGTGWVVQLGVFASRENAEHLAQQMKSRGFKASVSESGGSSRRLYRVRIGPAPDRASAQTLQGKLRAAGHPGTLVPLS
ncbi:MAG TPA: SPOR domain-containing protein [Steroidobacteraceae bacterium]|nr:SPOR domain-containing protein [Steroidobacteraceae bacterium]